MNIDEEHPAPDRWFCDVCGEELSAEEGNVEWDRGSDRLHPGRRFAIVHRKRECSYRSFHDGDTYLNLTDFLRPEGAWNITNVLNRFADQKLNAEEQRDFIDLLRRLYVPHWEMARSKFVAYAKDNGLDPKGLTDASPEVLKQIANWKHR